VVAQLRHVTKIAEIGMNDQRVIAVADSISSAAGDDRSEESDAQLETSPVEHKILPTGQVCMHRTNSESTDCLAATVTTSSLVRSRSIRIKTWPDFWGKRSDLLAFFGALLYRYSGQERITFDVKGNNSAQDQETTANWETVEIDFAEDPGFSALVARLEERIPNAMPAIYQTCCAPEDLRRMLCRDTHAASGRDALTLQLENVGDRFELRLNYFEESDDSIAAFARHAEMLLRSALERPNAPISHLEMMSVEELRYILVDQNGTTIEFERQSIPDAFENEVSRNPDATALIYLGQSLTYRELRTRAYRLATSLQGFGVGPEILIGVYLDDPLLIAITYLGIVVAGGVVVALDREWPRERLEQVVGESSVSFIVTAKEFVQDIPAGPHRLLTHETLESQQEGAGFHASKLTPDNAAYVVFTSGSTGTPKGVVGLHRTITSMPAMTRLLRTNEVFALSANLSFGAGLLGLFFPLIQGSAVLLVPRAVARDLPALVRAWEAANVTRITLVAPQLRQLGLLGPEVAVHLKKITTVALSGVSLTPDLLSMIYALFPQAMVVNAYSCLEIGTMTTRWETLPQDRTRPLTVGRVLPNIRVYILGPKLNVLPAGMPGEIYVGSADLSRGYLNRPDLTQERFLANPFGVPGISRLYRTGDVGRLLANGELEYRGRADHQVKVRGMRIELEEIEGALQAHEQVHHAAVVAYPQDGDSRLVAFLSAKPGFVLSTSEVRRRLSKELPAYMIPALFVVLDEFPLTGNGKIDRQRLPKASTTRPEINTEYASPKNHREAALAKIWEKELRIDGIGINDHFLELGGDSLIAVRIALRVQRELGYELAATSVFEYPTVRTLAEAFDTPEMSTDIAFTPSGKEPR
jgi:amino acid adenylation domain-containing protein